MDSFEGFVDLASNPKHTRWMSPVLLAAEAGLCTLILFAVPYTEIDWKTYMQQVKLVVDGERNYALIKGDTGPLVYPAIHVYLYTVLYYLTDHGNNIKIAQIVFMVLYLGTLSLVFACYKRVGAPPWVLPMLVLSKRLHSIFLLRLFNDCWAVMFLWATIYAFQRRWWHGAAALYTLGVGVKMILLLAAPAVGAVLLQGAGLSEGLIITMFCPQLQILPSAPFIMADLLAYVTRAFDFGRQFLYKWTVNWRFVSEETFLSKSFSTGLLLANALLLGGFLSTRWVKPSSNNLWQFARTYTRTIDNAKEKAISSNVTPQFVMTSMLGAMVIGMLCARSLHYQFFVYLGWATPYILWKSGLHPLLVYGLWAGQEWAWLTYPSTRDSSGTVVGLLVVQVVAAWFASGSTPKQVPKAKAHTE